MKRPVLSCSALLTVICAVPADAQAGCRMSAGDFSWARSALQASDLVMLHRLHLIPDGRPTIILFDRTCSFEATSPSGARWIGTSHNGSIKLPDGGEAPPAVTSFASRDEKSGRRFFVMALPSIWYAAKVMPPGDKGLTGVFVHEFSHTRQMDVLNERFESAAAIHKLPDDFTDDTIQKRFQSDPNYSASIGREIELLYRAADEPDVLKARSLAREALELMQLRQKRSFTGEDAWLRPYDDLFLTMEGFGQWAGYAWLSDKKGGGMDRAAAMTKMRGSGRWWSQDEGLALFLVIDKLLPGWAGQAFGSPPLLGIEMLGKAVAAEQPPSVRS